MLSHNSAFKAEKLGYSNIKVYADGMPDWKARGGPVSVSNAFVKKQIDDKASYTLIDARPKRVADKGMIPTAINISDTEFDKQVDKLPADKATTLIYYCGGLECVLSDNSAEKARKLGYTNVLTYPPGYPEWEKLNGPATPMAAMAGAAANMASGMAQAMGQRMPGKEKGSVTVDSFQAVWKSNPGSMMLVDVRDVSTDDVCIELTLKREADENKVLAYLYKQTPLQTNFAVNLTCLVPTENPEVGRPERLDLAQILWHFLHFRLEVVTRRLQHELSALERRIHILSGFAAIFAALDEILRIIRKR